MSGYGRGRGGFAQRGSWWTQNKSWHRNQQDDYYDDIKEEQELNEEQPMSNNRHAWFNEDLRHQQHHYQQPANNPFSFQSRGNLQQLVFDQPPPPRPMWTMSQMDFPDPRHNNEVPPLSIKHANFTFDSRGSLKISCSDDEPRYVYAQQPPRSYSSSEVTKPLTTKLYRRGGDSEYARPGLRSFCNFVNRRPLQLLANIGNGQRLQFKYKIKAALWHRTKWGLHKKKTKLDSKQARYRAIRLGGKLFCRKAHSHFWTRNASKPRVRTVAVNPWDLKTKDDEESDKYLSCVEDFLPSSWQHSRYAYFKRPEYQLFKLDTSGLEFNSLNAHFTKCGLEIQQNVSMFGSYQSRKQQLVAGGVALVEVVRFVGVRRRHLRALCTKGLDARRLNGHVNCFASAAHAHAALEDKDQGYLVAGRAVAARRPRMTNEFYPEYIIACRNALTVE